MKQKEHPNHKPLNPTKLVFLTKVVQLKKKYFRHRFHARNVRTSKTWKANVKAMYLYRKG